MTELASCIFLASCHLPQSRPAGCLHSHSVCTAARPFLVPTKWPSPLLLTHWARNKMDDNLQKILSDEFSIFFQSAMNKHLVYELSWYQKGDRPFPESLLTPFTAPFIHYQVSVCELGSPTIRMANITDICSHGIFWHRYWNAINGLVIKVIKCLHQWFN